MTVSMPGPCCAYELVGGVFCKTQPGRGGRLGWWNGHGDVAANADGEDGEGEEGNHVFGSRSLYATWLPSDGRAEGAGRTVVRDDLGIPTRDFAMDPSQDLMVLFKGGEDLGMYVSLISGDFSFTHA